MSQSEFHMKEMRKIVLRLRIQTKVHESQKITQFLNSDDFPQKFAEWLEMRAHVKSAIGVVFQSETEIMGHADR